MRKGGRGCNSTVDGLTVTVPVRRTLERGVTGARGRERGGGPWTDCDCGWEGESQGGGGLD